MKEDAMIDPLVIALVDAVDRRSAPVSLASLDAARAAESKASRLVSDVLAAARKLAAVVAGEDGRRHGEAAIREAADRIGVALAVADHHASTDDSHVRKEIP
jgi:hypothetical protein